MLRFFCLIFLFLKLVNCSFSDLNGKDYWIVQIKSSDVESAIELADDNGYYFYKTVTGFPNVFVFKKKEIIYGNGKRSQIPSKHLESDERVIWAEQPKELMRSKRHITEDMLLNDFDLLWDLIPQKNSKQPIFNDELWDQEWYMQDTKSKPGHLKIDLNVLPVYKKGYTGQGVRVAVLDDGLEYTHDDLFPNYDSDISWDCNHDNPDPSPNKEDRFSSHGTRCAGEIAMVANNGKCGVGVAFGAKIGGIKLLGGRVYDLVEGMALGFAYDKVDVYSSSWGPNDDGKSMERPGVLAMQAIERGIKDGRNGKGAIYVWASGNGGRKNDNCNCDGYANSIYTIAVGSVTQHGTKPWYGEMCPAIMVVTYSSGADDDQMITTTDTGNLCTVRHTGTSASAPLAAGIIALGLEANSNLTWRDVQHLIVATAEYEPLMHNKGWQVNSAGIYYNIRFGFGMMDADKFVTQAVNWRNVPLQRKNLISSNEILPLNISESLKITFEYKSLEIVFLEHIELTISMDYTIRGDLEFYLKSPKDTYVQILGSRKNDKSKTGFDNWTFMSVATWLESPYGVWELKIVDSRKISDKNFGTLKNATLTIYGIREMPDYYL